MKKDVNEIIYRLYLFIFHALFLQQSRTVKPTFSGPAEGQITLVDNDSEEIPLAPEFDDYGQAPTATESNSTLEACYQEGVAHAAALHCFMLNSPGAGVFSCSTSVVENPVSVELLDGKRYVTNGAVGTFGH